MLAGKNIDVKAELPSDLEIAFSCRLQRSPHALFEAWTKPEHLRHWWGCEGSQVIHCAIDLRVGGPWSLTMRMADGSEHPFHGAYREIEPPHRLVYTECYDMPQFGRPEWLTTVTFDEIDGATLVTQTLKHKTRAVRDAHLQSGMQEGAIQSLTRLSEYTATIEKTPIPND
jgi:uncharacterized protein YndB with AHSA1/START domain